MNNYNKTWCICHGIGVHSVTVPFISLSSVILIWQASQTKGWVQYCYSVQSPGLYSSEINVNFIAGVSSKKENNFWTSQNCLV